MSPFDAAGVRRLAVAGETFTVEFKGEGRGPLSDSELVEAAICLANGEGGVVLVGVEDDGRITGARPRHGAGTDPRRVEALVANRTNPPLAVRCSAAPVLAATRGAGRVGIDQAAGLIQRPEAPTRAVLDRLVGRGLLARIGTEAEPAWIVAKGGSVTGDAAEAVRRTARERGVVTRQDVVALTGLSADQAKRLLARLAADGELVRVGRGRGAAYRTRNGR